MPALPFSKWSPGGNTTLLFPAAGRIFVEDFFSFFQNFL